MVSIFFCLVLTALCALIALPSGLMLVQMAVAWPHRRQPQQTLTSLAYPPFDRPPIGIIIPAHNESSVIGKTLLTLKPQLGPKDRLLVVADNCVDDTAVQAALHGAEVVERHDLDLRGKGHALDRGWQVLREDGKLALFLCVDADCVVHDGAVTALARQAWGTGRPTQARYLILNDDDNGDASVRQRISEFAYIVNSLARPIGMHRMGLGCQLVGSGMMFPRACLAQTSLASGHLVEDLVLGLTLAAKGQPPVFCKEAHVTSTFPIDKAAQEVQRTRWEHGRLLVITQVLPRLLVQALKTGDLQLFFMCLDAGVPPLTLLLMLALASTAVSAVFLLLTGLSAPLWVSAIGLGMLIAALTLAWHRFGRDRLSVGDLLRAMLYVLWKAPIYGRYLISRQTEWVRTKRGGSAD